MERTLTLNIELSIFLMTGDYTYEAAYEQLLINNHTGGIYCLSAEGSGQSLNFDWILERFRIGLERSLQR